MATTTRFLGTCAACRRTIKVRDNNLVHHGYQRPGYGYIVGDCFGVGYEPHELSPKCAQDLLPRIVNQLEGSKRRLERLKNGEIVEIKDLHFKRDDHGVEIPYEVLYTPEHPKWARRLEAEIREYEMRVRGLGSEQERLTNLIATWTLLPLATIEEEQEAKRLKKAEQERANLLKKVPKLTAAIERYQSRLAVASRRKTASVFLGVYDTAASKLRDLSGFKKGFGYNLSREDVWKLLGCNHVWEELGIMKDGVEIFHTFDGRYNSYQIPYDVQEQITAYIREGKLSEVSFQSADVQEVLMQGRE